MAQQVKEETITLKNLPSQWKNTQNTRKTALKIVRLKSALEGNKCNKN